MKEVLMDFSLKGDEDLLILVASIIVLSFTPSLKVSCSLRGLEFGERS